MVAHVGCHREIAQQNGSLTLAEGLRELKEKEIGGETLAGVKVKLAIRREKSKRKERVREKTADEKMPLYGCGG
jgi:hypothetical protein